MDEVVPAGQVLQAAKRMALDIAGGERQSWVAAVLVCPLGWLLPLRLIVVELLLPVWCRSCCCVHSAVAECANEPGKEAAYTTGEWIQWGGSSKPARDAASCMLPHSQQRTCSGS